MVGVFVAFIRVVYGRMIYMSLPSCVPYTSFRALFSPCDIERLETLKIVYFLRGKVNSNKEGQRGNSIITLSLPCDHLRLCIAAFIIFKRI